MEQKVCAACSTPWVRKGTTTPLSGFPREGVGQPGCSCDAPWKALGVLQTALYTHEQLLQMVQSAPGGNSIIYWGNAPETSYAMDQEYYWHMCREVTFGRAVSKWRFSKDPGPWSIYMYYPETDPEPLVHRVYNTSSALYQLEQYMQFPSHQIECIQRSLACNALVWKYTLCDEWRYAPAMFFIVTEILRRDTHPRTYHRQKLTLRMVKKYGLQRVFGDPLLVQLKKGTPFRQNRGNEYFMRKTLPSLRQQLLEEEETLPKTYQETHDSTTTNRPAANQSQQQNG